MVTFLLICLLFLGMMAIRNQIVYNVRIKALNIISKRTDEYIVTDTNKISRWKLYFEN